MRVDPDGDHGLPSVAGDGEPRDGQPDLKSDHASVEPRRGRATAGKTVSTWAKSIARIAWACAERNCRQVGPDRRGAGSSPALFKMVQTVEAAKVWPSPTNSP